MVLEASVATTSPSSLGRAQWALASGLGWLSLPGRTSLTPPSALSTHHPDGMLDDASSIEGDDVRLLPLSLDVQPSSASDVSTDDGDVTHPVIGVARRIGRHVSSFFGSSQPSRGRRRRGVMFFLPAFSTSTGGVTLNGDDSHPATSTHSAIAIPAFVLPA